MQILVKEVGPRLIRYNSIFIATLFLIEGQCVCVISIAVSIIGIEIFHTYVIFRYFIPKKCCVRCLADHINPYVRCIVKLLYTVHKNFIFILVYYPKSFKEWVITGRFMIGNYYFCPVLGFFQIKHVNVSTTVSKLKVGVDIHNYLRMYKLIVLIRISKLSYK